MGGGIAGHLARAGLEVRLADASAELAQQAREALLARTRGHVAAGLLHDTAATETVRAAADLEAAVDGADLVIEAVPEDPELKADTLARASRATDGIIATNTSSLPIAGLAESGQEPQPFLGGHRVNPPEWTPGMGVIRGAAPGAHVRSRGGQ